MRTADRGLRTTDYSPGSLRAARLRYHPGDVRPPLDRLARLRVVRSGWRFLVVFLLAGGVPAQAAGAADPVRVTLIYTGRSLGALGVLQDTDEHELLVEQAEKAKLPVHLGTRLGWRAGHVSLFSPDRDLDAADLAAFAGGSLRLTEGSVRALVSNNAVLLEIADNPHDLLEMIRSNPRVSVDFPDLREATLQVRRGRLADGRRLIVVMESAAPWPVDPEAWTKAEVNRIEVEDGAMYEIAVNLGQMGPRATVLASARRQAAARGATAVVLDLGARDGDLGLERVDRARLDYTTLTALGYRLIVPYEFELALGAPALKTLGGEFRNLQFLASNVKTTTDGLLSPRYMLDIGGVHIGLIGLVDPDLQGVLPKSSLAAFEFESPIDAAAREIAALRRAGADAVVALSNLHPRDNNLLAREVAGLDAIVADLHVRWSPEEVETQVEMPGRPLNRPGSPALVARSFANGLGLGALELEFRDRPGGGRYLAAMSHRLDSVTDRVPADAALVKDIRARAARAERPRGPVLVPPFTDLVAARPTLKLFDGTAAEGRISKRMWEEFLARLIRGGARAEAGIIRKLPNFPPAIGELHDAEVRSWLWTEDSIVTLDLSGADLKTILKEDTRGDLVIVGLDRKSATINGRRIQDVMLYRVATTDLLLDGTRYTAFPHARRVERWFRIAKDGSLNASGREPLQIRTYVLEELARMRGTPAGAGRLARLLDRDPAYEPLFTFSFDRPTIFASFNRTENTQAYGLVPESRIVAPDSQVIGVMGHYVLGYERARFGLDLGLLAAYSRNRITSPDTGQFVTSEAADDIRGDLTLRARRGSATRVQPFVRAAFDTEFTPSIDPQSGLPNRKQQLARGTLGLGRTGARWTRVELGAATESDIARGSQEYGFEGTVQYQRRFPGASQLVFRWDNTFSHYFPAPTDDVTDLGTTVRTVTELQVPLMGELSLSIAVDIFAFKGKVAQTSKPGASGILRLGLSYDRLWKPRYQPFF